MTRKQRQPEPESTVTPAAAFHFAETADPAAMSLLVRQMQETLWALHHGDIPSKDYSLETLRQYCTSLVTGQRDKVGDLVAGSWCVSPNTDDMPGDARVDFVFFPTYIAAATLSKVLMRFPGIAIQIPGYLDAIRTGLWYSTLRRLEGHGYDSEWELPQAVQLLALGEVPALLSQAPELCPELAALLIELAETYAARLDTGSTTSVWGIDTAELVDSVAASTALLREPDLLKSIEEGRRQSRRSLRRPLSW